VPFESLKETSPDAFKRLLMAQPILKKYHLFTMAQNIGVTFGPKDLKVDDLVYFNLIRQKVDEVVRSTGGK
jgi:hypothetical protein